MKKNNKKHTNNDYILETLLNSDILNEIKSSNLSISNEVGINEIIYLINLTEKISTYYKDDLDSAFEYGIRGLRLGLASYRDKVLKRDDDVRLAPYVTWFIKSSIEFKIGIDNEDTKAFANLN